MRKRRVVFVGNCQASALSNVYRNLFSDGREEDVAYFDDLGIEGPQLRQALEGVDTIVALERDFNYGLQELKDQPGTSFHSFPMVLGGYIWPFATEPHVRNVAERPIWDGPYPVQRSDSFLNRLILKGVSPEDALDQYMALDVAKAGHVDRIRELYAHQQRARDARTGFDIGSFIEREIGRQALFMSPHHPNAVLLNVVAAQLFERMGVASTVIEEGLGAEGVFPFAREELPIHPALVRHFGLTYIAPDQRYRFNDEVWLTFEEYVIRYMRFDHNAELKRGIHFAGEDPQGALAHLEAGLRLSPRSDRGWRAKGQALELLGRTHEASDAYRQSSEIAPDELDGWLGMIRTASALGQTADARDLAEGAAARHPRHAFARHALAEQLARAGEADAEAAAVEIRAAMRLLPGHAAFRHLGAMLLCRAGYLGEAEVAARTAMLMEPDRVESVNLLAEIYEEQGRREEALALLQDALDRGLSHDQTFSLLGNFHLRSHNFDAAEAAFSRGVKLFGAQRPDLAAGLRDTQQTRINMGGGEPPARATLTGDDLAALLGRGDPDAFFDHVSPSVRVVMNGTVVAEDARTYRGLLDRWQATGLSARSLLVAGGPGELLVTEAVYATPGAQAADAPAWTRAVMYTIDDAQKVGSVQMLDARQAGTCRLALADGAGLEARDR